MIENVFSWFALALRLPVMSEFSLPAVSVYPLDQSLYAVERIVAQSQTLTDERLKRSLLKAGCDVLDHALRWTEQSRPHHKSDANRE